MVTELTGAGPGRQLDHVAVRIRDVRRSAALPEVLFVRVVPALAQRRNGCVVVRLRDVQRVMDVASAAPARDSGLRCPEADPRVLAGPEPTRSGELDMTGSPKAPT